MHLGVQIISDDDTVTGTDAPLYETTPDEATTAGDENRLGGVG